MPVQAIPHDLKATSHLLPAAKARSRVLLVLLILALFVVAGFFEYNDVDGDDLSASYVGCRLIASGQAAHLYTHDPLNFAAIGPDDPWQSAADQGNYEGFLHPYVQTPLWAYALQPLCTRTDFPLFKQIFSGLAMLCFAGVIGLVAWFWTPDLFHPLPIGVIVLAVWFSQPFQYAMSLMQTHVLFILLALLSLMLAERKRPGLAGLLLACTAAVKVTPAILVLYWLLRKRWQAVASMAAWSAMLLVATVLTTGQPLFRDYLANLHRVSQVLLVAQNNQSFAAWCMGYLYPAAEVKRFAMLPLPHLVRLGSTALTLLCAIAGGLLDRRRPPTAFERRPTPQSTRAPIGALLTLVAATAFAPIAWTHYAIVLIAPVMVLAQAYRDLRRRWIPPAIILILALNLRPLATDVVNLHIGRLSLLRSHFYAEILCILALGVLAWKQPCAPVQDTTSP